MEDTMKSQTTNVFLIFLGLKWKELCYVFNKIFSTDRGLSFGVITFMGLIIFGVITFMGLIIWTPWAIQFAANPILAFIAWLWVSNLVLLCLFGIWILVLCIYKFFASNVREAKYISSKRKAEQSK